MKKQIRKMTNRTAGYIFFYNLIMIAVMFGAIVIMTIAAMAGAGAEQAADRAVDALGQNMDALLGTLSIAGVCGGLLFLGIASCRTGLLRELFQRDRKMDAGRFFRIFCVLMACQMIFTVAAFLAELALNPFGLTLKEAAESASAVSTDLPCSCMPALWDLWRRSWCSGDLSLEGCWAVGRALPLSCPPCSLERCTGISCRAPLRWEPGWSSAMWRWSTP